MSLFELYSRLPKRILMAAKKGDIALIRSLISKAKYSHPDTAATDLPQIINEDLGKKKKKKRKACQVRIFPTPRRDTTKDRESRLCLLPAPLLPPMGQIEMHFIFEGETCHESRGFSRSLLTDATRDSASVLHHRLYRTDNSAESSLVNR